jgi:DNA-binding winged helix-turn-helix (wHTH) protein
MILVAADSQLEATPLGQAVAAKGISIATAREFEHWVGQCETRPWPEIDLLYAAANAPDGRMLQVMLTAREYEEAGYVGVLKRLTREEQLQADTPINRIRNSNTQPFFDEVRAIKIVLFLNEWLQQRPIGEIEESFNTMAGQVLSAAEQLSWLMDSAAAIAVAVGADKAFVERIKTLAERMQYGVEEELLPLTRIEGLELPRTALLRLHRHGLHTPAALVSAPPKLLREYLTQAQARKLKEWAAEQPQEAETKAQEVHVMPEKPLLIVDDREPGAIHLDGVRIGLQEKQYRLIRLLAAHPGECVPYETIYQELWGDLVVEDAQVHFQKGKIIKSIRAAAPRHAEIIKTVPKRGFTLNLSAEQVVLKGPAISHAA